MIKEFLRKIFSALKTPALAVCFLLPAGSVFVQQGPQDLIRQFAISFPIAALGNCENYTQCRNFCEDPLNQQTCIAYAKEKGIPSATVEEDQKESIVESAKKELGCDSYESCKIFCEQDEHFGQCSVFAQKYSLPGGYVADPADAGILVKAKTTLGCNSYETCKSYCEQGDNGEKCTEFARTVGIRGGAAFKGPGGCTSQASCKAYCSNPNQFQECSQYAPSKTGGFKGPGGCDSLESCKAYCDEHPQDCYGYSSTPYTPLDAVSACAKIAGCFWNGASCQCTASGGSMSPTPAPTYILEPLPTSGSSTTDYESQCKSTSGCSWTENTCQCTSYPTPTPTKSSTLIPTPTLRPTPTPTPQPTSPTSYESQCNSTPGCTWTENTCQCTSYPTPTPTKSSTPTPTKSPTSTPQPTLSTSDHESICKSTLGCTWTENTCKCSVQGVASESATSPEDIGKKYGVTFPIAALGNCQSCGACSTFCANLANKDACIAFVREKGIFEDEQKGQDDIYQRAKDELGCDSEGSCKTYCQEEANYEKCQMFASKYDIVDTPVILSPKTQTTIFQTQTVEIKAHKGDSLDLVLKPVDAIDFLFIGRTTVSADTERAVVTWDSTNTPNGEYNLFAVINPDQKDAMRIGPVTITITNPQTANLPSATVHDIVFPSQFEPNSVAVDKSTTIGKIEPAKVEDKKAGYLLKGQAAPNTIITLLIYSNPIVVTVRTDENGSWSYTLEKPLPSGEHTAYIVASRPDGTRVRSEPSTFIVPQAFAANNTNETLTRQSADETGPLKLFIFITLSLIGISLLVLLLLYKFKKQSSPFAQ